MSERDRAPIDQQWVRDYCDQFLKIAGSFSLNNPMREAVARRVEHVQDLVEAWQKRNWPREEPPK